MTEINQYITTLKEISENIQTGPFGSQLHESDYSENGTPVVMPKDMIGGRIVEASIARVSYHHVERLQRHQIKEGDILYPRRGDIAKCAFAKEKEKGWLCGTGCLKVTIDASKANEKFVFYYLQLPETTGWLEKHAVGATMLNLNTTILGNLPLKIPSLKVQEKIADTLSAYDDLIENNQKQIKLLEEAAQRLYKEWFVDLHFPGYENTKIVDGVPEGWMKVELASLFDFYRGKSYTSKELSEDSGKFLINLKNIQAWGGYKRLAEKRFNGAYKKNQIVNKGDIVMAVTDMTQERRLVGHVAMVPEMNEEAIISMDLIKIVPKENISSYYLYSMLRFSGIAEFISQHANGTNVLHLKPEAIMGIETVAPSIEVMRRFEEYILPLFEKNDLLENQIILLTEMRNRILPKLMSGEIEV